MFGGPTDINTPVEKDLMGTLAYNERPDLDVQGLDDWERQHLDQ